MERGKKWYFVDWLRLILATTTVGWVLFHSSSIEKETKKHTTAVRADTEKQLSEMYAILQLSLSRVDSCAVETDKKGNVLWMNDKARNTLRLTRGENVTLCMLNEGAEKHNRSYEKAMNKREDGTRPLAIIPKCQAVGKNGDIITVTVETWATPKGAMAFVTPIGE
jgi:hypothetical protein